MTAGSWRSRTTRRWTRPTTFLEVPDYEAYAIAFHPDYVKNGLVFGSRMPKSRKGPPAYNRIYRYDAKGSPRQLRPKSQRLIIEWDVQRPQRRRSALWAGRLSVSHLRRRHSGLGHRPDRAGPEESLCGILRIRCRDRPDEGKGYSIPPDNPYRHIEGARHEKYAIGLRNPWRMCLIRTRRPCGSATLGRIATR